MDSALTTVGLPIALAIIMFGLGLDLTLADFKRIGSQPKAVLVALGASWCCSPRSASRWWSPSTCRRCWGSA